MILFFVLLLILIFLGVLDAQPTSQARQHKVLHVFASCKHSFIHSYDMK